MVQHVLMFYSLLRTQLQLREDGEKKSVYKQMRGSGHGVYCVRDLHGNPAKAALER